jgi:hypothetical protein
MDGLKLLLQWSSRKSANADWWRAAGVHPCHSRELSSSQGLLGCHGWLEVASPAVWRPQNPAPVLQWLDTWPLHHKLVPFLPGVLLPLVPAALSLNLL